MGACVAARFLTIFMTDMERLHTDSAPAAVGPYSQAVKKGDHLFVSGQLPLTPDGRMVETDFAKQVRTSLSNLTSIVKAAGSGYSGRAFEIVKVTVYLTDLSRYAEFNEVYGEWFGNDPPARAVVGVAALPKDAPLEVECIAIS